MKLYGADTSPYARNVRVMCHELGLNDRVEYLIGIPLTSTTLRNKNPLGRIPVLECDDGNCIYDSTVIMEYLDTVHGGTPIFPKGELRWPVRVLHTLCNGIMEASVSLMMEYRRDAKREAPLQPDWWVERQYQAIDAGLAGLQSELDLLKHKDLHAGQIGALSVLGYLDLRFPDLGWADRYTDLAQWYAQFSTRPSAIASAPPAG